MSLQDSKSPIPRLLYTRRDALEALGLDSVFTLQTLEKRGRLHPIRLTGHKIYYNAEEVLRLARGE